MTTEPKDLVLEHLRHIRAVVDEHTSALADLRDGQTLIRHDIHTLTGHTLHQEQRIAALEAKMQTVFTRLDLSEDQKN